MVQDGGRAACPAPIGTTHFFPARCFDDLNWITLCGICMTYCGGMASECFRRSRRPRPHRS